MTEQPKTVVCTSCSAKFHVPDELIRGKLVKFRCRKCGAAIDVDGRRSARPAPPSPPTAEIAAIDTPATFSQRTLPPPRPPVVLSKSSPNLHPWPEPPRALSSTPPTALFESAAPDGLLPAEAARNPSNRGPKIAAFVALLMAAGLSGVGLAMRGSPDSAAVSETTDSDPAAHPSDPASADNRARAAAEAKREGPSRSSRAPTRVTDLPSAGEGVERATGSTNTAAGKPSPGTIEKDEPAVRAVANAAPIAVAPHAVEAHGGVPAADPGAAENAASPPAAPNAAELHAEPGAGDPSLEGANAAGPAIEAAAQPPAPAPPAAVGRSRGDFNTQAAREALEDAAGRAGKCKTIDTPSGTTARVAVTFAPSGHVTNAVIESGPFVGTAAGSCVASKFRAAKVPPFSGESVLVRKSVPF